MIIVNTTYQINFDTTERFVLWLRQEYIPRAIKSGDLSHPQLTKVLSGDNDGDCFALQLKAHSTAILHRWWQHSGTALADELTQLFGQKVVGFTTLLEEIEL